MVRCRHCLRHAASRCKTVCSANNKSGFTRFDRLKLFERAKEAVQGAQNRGKAAERSKPIDNDANTSWQSGLDSEFRRSSNLSASSNSSQDGNDIESYLREALKIDDEEPQPPTLLERAQGLWNAGVSRLTRLREVLLYNYYNWRQDTVSDLLLILAANSILIITGSFVKLMFVDPYLEGEPNDPSTLLRSSDHEMSFLERFWPDIYRVTLLTFGENFPTDSESSVFQVYSIAMALAGVIGFALLLALIEQILLEVLEANVQQGTTVFERGHILVLSQCVAGKDMETLWRVLGQICYAYAADGGRTVVVLSSKDKVVMEKLFRKAIPDRKGSRFIFRKGNPLLPNDLKEVSVVDAGSVIIVSDNSREANEADAQSVRVAVLIDELVQKHEAVMAVTNPRSFSSYKRPHIVVEVLESQNCTALDFSTEIALTMVLTRNINAKRLARMVTTPVIAGVSTMLYDFKTDSQQYAMNFPSLKGQLFKNVPFMFDNATVLGIFPANSDQLILNVSPGYVMQADDYVQLLRSSKISASQVRINPAFQRPSLGRWKPPILNDYTRVSLNGGGSITDECDSPVDSQHGALDDDDGVSKLVQTNTSPILISSSTSSSTSSSADYAARQSTETSSSREESVSDSTTRKRITVRKEATQPNTRFYVLPQAYLQNADENAPIKLLVVGWGDQGFMQALLRELDSGDSSLPVSSSVVFLNSHPFATIQAAIHDCSVSCLHVSHCSGNPLSAETYHQLIDISEYNCAMCLCDNKWVDPDLESFNGVDFLEQGDMLRLDSMLLLVQLHIRTALARQNLPDINIICEKLAIAGVTRFEDRFKLPLGISVNMTSFAAKVLVQSVYDPKHGLTLMAAVGKYANVTVVDSSVLVEPNEELSWWELVARAQVCGLVLFAYYDIPASLDIPLKLHSNPLFDRTRKRVWNTGNNRRKVICWRTTHGHLTPLPSRALGKGTGTLDIRPTLAASPALRLNRALEARVPPGVKPFDPLSLAVSDARAMQNIEILDLNRTDDVAALLAEDGLRLDPRAVGGVNVFEALDGSDSEWGEPAAAPPAVLDGARPAGPPLVQAAIPAVDRPQSRPAPDARAPPGWCAPGTGDNGNAASQRGVLEPGDSAGQAAAQPEAFALASTLPVVDVDRAGRAGGPTNGTLSTGRAATPGGDSQGTQLREGTGDGRTRTGDRAGQRRPTMPRVRPGGGLGAGVPRRNGNADGSDGALRDDDAPQRQDGGVLRPISGRVETISPNGGGGEVVAMRRISAPGLQAYDDSRYGEHSDEEGPESAHSSKLDRAMQAMLESARPLRPAASPSVSKQAGDQPSA